eukprot:CAMPEP_0201480810 /NCGR_PEP_ID=MMETSP0151_2-20130828/5214_1 /ASSEMBLY_ACC=CAM_ASM_000257 /TAXON_ID=200890 /ORGANISM="Paramoeba atlantica, Strain 621/1 / CCAP 1560/9" /LENGTH=360 /DNA_ID=CAMNT_0047862781 /DNA_START=25 /DNA_END=1105 /DNA_ORIENTATION=-
MAELDAEKLGAFKGALLNVCAGSLALVNMGIGDALGLYKCLAANKGLTPAELAEKTETDVRYIEDWCVNQALNGVIVRSGEDGPAGTGVFSMTPEQIACLATDGGPHDMVGGGQAILGVANQLINIVGNFKSGGGMSWSDQHEFIHVGVRRFFAPLYRHMLVQSIIPALDGVEAKLKAGCRVLDVGCGQGESTIAIGKAYEKSEVIGVDFHQGSIDYAKKENTLSNVKFTTEDASKLTESSGKFDLICIFDCFHDMSDPDGAAVAFRSLLADGGSVFLIEPMAGETYEGNNNIVGRVFSGFSPTCCLQSAKSAPGESKLGTLTPAGRHEALFKKAGFSSFSRIEIPGLGTNEFSKSKSKT